MSGTDGTDVWDTNLPYLGLAALVTVVNYTVEVAGVLVGVKDAGAALLIVGILVTVALDALGVRRASLHDSLFGR